MIFDKIFKGLQKYQEWRHDTIVKTEKIYDEATTHKYTGNGLCNKGKEYYMTITLTGYVETHYKKGRKSYELSTFCEWDTNIPEDHQSYYKILHKEKEYAKDKLEKVYYEYIHNVKQENDK